MHSENQNTMKKTILTTAHEHKKKIQPNEMMNFSLATISYFVMKHTFPAVAECTLNRVECSLALTRPDEWLPKSCAGGQGQSLDHSGRSSEVQKKNHRKSKV